MKDNFKSVGRDRRVGRVSRGGAQNTLYEVSKYLVKKFNRGYNRIILWHLNTN